MWGNTRRIENNRGGFAHHFPMSQKAQESGITYINRTTANWPSVEETIKTNVNIPPANDAQAKLQTSLV